MKIKGIKNCKKCNKRFKYLRCTHIYCKDCSIKVMRERQTFYRNSKETREKYLKECRVYNLKTKLDNPEHFLLMSTKRRAKTRGLEFNIEEKDIIIPKICPALKIKLTPNKGKPKDSSPSIDRIDNTKGYIKGNIKIISYRANVLKRDATLKELDGVLKYVKSEQKARKHK